MTVTRRELVVRTAQTTAMSAVGGTLWYQWLRSAVHASPTMLRPPGALQGQDFLAQCLKCGSCVNACPFAILRLAQSGADNTPGTPYFMARHEACRMCQDIPCVKACPTGALTPSLTDIRQARMGLAVIDQETCLAYLGLRCEICYRVCPRMDYAITLRYRHQERTGKQVFFEPLVHSDTCTGCGMCEHACPLDETAIHVLPAALTKGVMGTHYRLDGQSDNPVGDRPPTKSQRELKQPGQQPVLKTLNSAEKLYD